MPNRLLIAVSLTGLPSVMLEVAMTRTLPLDLSRSIWVKRQLTTRMESDGLVPDIAALLAAVKDLLHLNN